MCWFRQRGFCGHGHDQRVFGEFDSLYILFQIMEIVCVFLGSNWKWYFLFLVESSSGIWNYSFILCVLGYLNYRISLICRTCGWWAISWLVCLSMVDCLTICRCLLYLIRILFLSWIHVIKFLVYCYSGSSQKLTMKNLVFVIWMLLQWPPW